MLRRIPSVRIRTFLALATALAGLMNIISALFPAFHWRYLLLRDMVPVHIINDSDVATVLLGILLILLADGLAKRHRRAMLLTLGILIISAVFHLTKGLDYEESLICLGLASLLFARRSDYVVPARPVNFSRASMVVTSFGILYYVYDLLGFRILSPWIHPTPSLKGALLEPIRLVTDSSVYHYHGYQAHWFGTSLVVVGSIALAFCTALILRPFIPIHRSNSLDRERARELVHRFGHDTLSYFALRDDRSYFFDEGREAFLSYKIWRNVALVGGGPVGPTTGIPGLIESFRQFCEANGLIPCFVGVSGDQLPVYQSSNLRHLKIGEESLIRLEDFDVGRLKRKVRRAERHCGDCGITAHMFAAPDLPASLRPQAGDISRSWVRTKGGAERGFSMTLGRFPRVEDRDARVLVAVEGERLVGFLTFVPVFQANGWSLDMMRRHIDSPNGLTEFMVLQAARQLQAEGYEFMSLNFASLSSTQAAVAEPRAVGSLRKFLFHNLSSVYQLKSLYQFNVKFDPEWSSRYLVYGDLIRVPRVIAAVVQAEDPVKLSTLAAVFRR